MAERATASEANKLSESIKPMNELHTKLYVRLQKLVNFYILKKKIELNETPMKSLVNYC